jgi:hypothetical protein
VSEVAVTSINKPALAIKGRGRPPKGGEVMDKMGADDDGWKGRDSPSRFQDAAGNT